MSIEDMQFSNLSQRFSGHKRVTQSFMFDFGSQVVPYTSSILVKTIHLSQLFFHMLT